VNRPGRPISGAEGADPRAGRLAALAARLGVQMPPFESPLAAFQLDGHRGAGEPVFLGGDLHAVHPAAGGATRGAERDASLDGATISLADHEHEPIEVTALEGVWCTRIDGARLPAAPDFMLDDSDGRIRAWLLLPPPHLMVGIAHLWLPSLPPPENPSARGLSDVPRA